MKIIRHFRQVVRNYYTVKNDLVRIDENRLIIAKRIQQRIKIGGPITVADYMKEVLTNPCGGYYTTKESIGQTGDFITSPELSQVFGEMVAVWFLNEWSKAGRPRPFQIVELGPGRGSLCQDVLRVFDHFDALRSATVELVEVSPLLSDLQARKLCVNTQNSSDDGSHYKEGVAYQGTPIRWHKHLTTVPNRFTLLVAHEFFDALPIHKCVRTDTGYREVLIDNVPIRGGDEEIRFRYVLAKDETPASKMYVTGNETRQHVELSPESWRTMKEIAARLSTDGGLALIADYGHCDDGDGDTFRAYKRHRQVDPLIDAGSCDLTADVDFHALKKVASSHGDVLVFGPVDQRDFLLRMGVDERFEALKKAIGDDAKTLESLDFSYRTMMDEDQMGKRFKLLSIVPATMAPLLDKFPVAGFS